MVRLLVLLAKGVLLIVLISALGDPAVAQRPPDREASGSVRQSGTSQIGAPRSDSKRERVGVPGTGLPPAAEPGPPPSFEPVSPARAPRSRARAKSGLAPPSGPEQVPLTGLEWLAAAGLLYAIKRLRRGWFVSLRE